MASWSSCLFLGVPLCLCVRSLEFQLFGKNMKEHEGGGVCILVCLRIGHSRISWSIISRCIIGFYPTILILFLEDKKICSSLVAPRHPQGIDHGGQRACDTQGARWAAGQDVHRHRQHQDEGTDEFTSVSYPGDDSFPWQKQLKDETRKGWGCFYISALEGCISFYTLSLSSFSPGRKNQMDLRCPQYFFEPINNKTLSISIEQNPANISQLSLQNP